MAEFKDSHKAVEPEKDGAYAEDGEVITYATGARPPLLTRMGLTADSFKRRTLADKHNQLNKTMKTRHLNMIAIGGSIGAGFFVGSGSALRSGGPASVVIDFFIIGVMMFNVVYALGELAIVYPISGGFYTLSDRFIDPSWGFAMGWNYVIQWAIVLPLEITVAGLTVGYWNAGVNIAVWITVFWALIIIVAVFGVLGYAEEEFWVAILKLGTTVVFLIMAFIFVLGGGPESGLYSEYWGARTWYDPGAFANGFYGFCGVFVTAAFSFSGTELVGLAAAESETPQQSLPSAVKQVFWRITLFYILGLFFVGLLVRSDDSSLLSESSGDTSASPFVIAAVNAGIPAFGDWMNVVIMFSVISIGISGVYGGSRTLTALAEQGYAPPIFKYIDRAGRPLFSTIFVIAFSPLAYINLAAAGGTVFAWLLSLSGLAALFTWGSISLAHVRFRHAWKYHGHTIDELPFQHPCGIWGSYLSLFLIFIVFAAQFYTAVYPMTAYDFFLSYLALFVVIFFYAVGFAWKRKGWRKLSEIDVDSGRRELNWEAHEKLMEKRRNWPRWRKILNIFI